MNYYKIYKKVINDIGKIKEDDEKFNNMFLLTCLLIYNLSSMGKNLDKVLKILSEFDYKKNFEQK